MLQLKEKFSNALSILMFSVIVVIAVNSNPLLLDGNTDDTEALIGIAELESTPIYSDPELSVSPIKTYVKGSILRFEKYSEDWYFATVSVDGKMQEGFIYSEHIELVSGHEQNQLKGLATQEVNVRRIPSQSASSLKSYARGNILYYESFSNNWYKAKVFIGEQSSVGYIHKKEVETLNLTNQILYQGLASSVTSVKVSPTSNSSTLKTYDRGRILYYKSFSNEWYEAIVIINNEHIRGYINKKNVETLNLSNQEPKQGLSVDQTKVYKYPSVGSAAQKIYDKGTVLHYKTFSNDWFQATIILNGKKQTGYINKKDVETLDLSSRKSVKGLAVKQTKIYQEPTVDSTSLKSYSQGNILQYKSFSNDWFQAIVFLDGEKHTGYINKKDVETLDLASRKTFRGLAIEDAKVYKKPTLNSSNLKSYRQGSILYYKTFSRSWYEATVYLDGEPTTGYIYAKDAETLLDSNTSLKGYARRALNVYGRAVNTSKVVRTYEEGHLLYYEAFSENWYRAKVYSNGRYITGYISKRDVRDYHKDEAIDTRFVGRESASVYTQLSKSSNQLKSYDYNQKLIVRDFTDNWYKATVYVNQKPIEGYISKNDTVSNKISSKDIVFPQQVYSYTEMVEDINALEKTYPNLITVNKIGRSVEGRDIHLVKLGFGDTKITINGSHHAREWITTNLIMEQIDVYSDYYVNYKSMDNYNIRDLLNKVTIYFVPMVNPDGVTLNQQGPSSFSNTHQLIKINNNSWDFSSWKANSRGVDLNRQYPAGWDRIDNGALFPSSEKFKGSVPLSEPESKAIYNLANNNEFKTHVAYHSTGEVLYWSYNATGNLLRTSKKIANLISNETGYKLMHNSYLYSNGGYTDWVIDTLKKPGFTIEISPYVANKPTPISNFARIWRQNKAIPAILMNEAYNYRFSR